ncbi:AEC family transporter [Maribrevibacterium harenarium]|uniref:AEC family transporter n=1 Tax=Maribrevibacterium harenarium TaxID=2589817 RepID=A0A501WIZ9_9GAMM|nr:AEC family transporter [Maribrevibacterium harenarium]TPE48752.1 AEC family transporter [Maribrevibacterium harenarium]
MEFYKAFSFATTVTAPIFLLLVLGVLLRRFQLIDEHFSHVASRLVFNVALPVMLFMSVLKVDLTNHDHYAVTLLGLLATIALYFTYEFLTPKLISNRTDRGIVIQGAFRSNMGIIGLAFCFNAFGPDVAGVASLYLGAVTVLYNVLSVITLNRSLNSDSSPLVAIKNIARNPLIIAILLAYLLSYLDIKPPAIILTTGSYLGQMTLPLALLCAGATLNFKVDKHSLNATFVATLGKLLVSPIVVTGSGFLLGFRGQELGVLFLMSSSPTAAASYVMAKAYGGNASLAANIIALTTILSIAFISLGILLLRSAGLI